MGRRKMHQTVFFHPLADPLPPFQKRSQCYFLSSSLVVQRKAPNYLRSKHDASLLPNLLPHLLHPQPSLAHAVCNAGQVLRIFILRKFMQWIRMLISLCSIAKSRIIPSLALKKVVLLKAR